METINRNDFLKALTIQTETVSLDTLNGVNIVVRDLNIEEDAEVKKLQAKLDKKEINPIEVIKKVCEFGMVEPTFFTDEEYQQLGKHASAVMFEIFLKIQKVGLTDEQKEAYDKNFIEGAQKVVEDEAKQLEDERKKKKSGKDLSSN